MKALTLATVCLLTTPAFSQDMGGMMAAQAGMDASNAAAAAATAAAMHMQQAQASQLLQQQQQAIAPAVFYAPASGDKTVSPQAIEVEVPVYSQFQPRAQTQKLVSEIKASQFFLEVNPLRLSAYGGDFESNNTSNNGPDLELDVSEFKFKMMPLDFKFGFENSGWGGFAEVLVSDGEDRSEAVLYTKVGIVKLGAGLTLSVTDDETKVKSQNVLVAKGESQKSEVGPYFYAAFEIVNDNSVVIEQWNKIGGVYEKEEEDGVTTYKGVSFLFNPALDVMFKINPKLLIGIGAEFEYRRFSGEYKISNNPNLKGVGNIYGFELNLIKTKFLF